VVSSLLSANAENYESDVKNEYQQIRERSSRRRTNIVVLDYSAAVSRAFTTDWSNYTPPEPNALGCQTFCNYPLDELVDYIDWSPFFMTWELAGKFPKILDDDVVGETARSLYADAREMLKTIVDDGILEARGVVGIWPANREGSDDIVLFDDQQRQSVRARLHHLRQQTEKQAGAPNYCLADFIAPAGTGDYLGGFAVTTGIGLEEAVAAHEARHDDYSAIMLKALADRLAEAFAERMHERMRQEIWGYASDEHLDAEALIKEAYRGIRPAPGYPACPDHTEKRTLFELLDAEAKTTIALTESYAMTPAAAVSGWYFAHPDARYFGVGRIGEDQVADYAQRKGWSIETASKWLKPNLR
jgi:5-methyltetrahydrofolate--homocysteine methyltransferase